MENYKHILLAVDLHPNFDPKVVERAMQLVEEHKAKLTVLHVIEHINAYGVAQAYPTVLNIEEKMVEDAKKELESMFKKLGEKQVDIIIEVGSPKNVILDNLKELDIDLVILGSHGRHGISILLGSTSNAVLHHAECDVLAVRMKL